MKVPFNVDLTGKTAIVTGGSGVLCSAMAYGLAVNGAKVAIIGRNKEKLAKLWYPDQRCRRQPAGSHCICKDVKEGKTGGRLFFLGSEGRKYQNCDGSELHGNFTAYPGIYQRHG